MIISFRVFAYGGDADAEANEHHSFRMVSPNEGTELATSSGIQIFFRNREAMEYWTPRFNRPAMLADGLLGNIMTSLPCHMACCRQQWFVRIVPDWLKLSMVHLVLLDRM